MINTQMQISEELFIFIFLFVSFMYFLSNIIWLWDGTFGQLIDLLKERETRKVFPDQHFFKEFKHIILYPLVFTMIFQYYGFSRKRKLYIAVFSFLGSVTCWMLLRIYNAK